MSTYSTSLRLELIANGAQVGNWGDTTNNNFGTLVEQAITGVQSITMLDADYTLTNLNGTADEARNAVLMVGGSNTAIRNVIAPLVEKVYIVYNGTSGGYNIIIKASTGVGVTIPSGTTQIVYCDGTNFYAVLNPNVISGNVSITGTLTASGTITGSSFTGAGTGLTGTAPSLSIGGNAATATLAATATTANSATTAAGLSATLVVGSGGTGKTSITANSVILGNGTSAVQEVAPGTSGNVLKSNGTTWVSGAGFTWNVQDVSSNTNSYSIPANAVLVLGTCYHYMGGNSGSRMSVNVKNSSGTTLYTYMLTGGNENNGGDGGSGMSTRSAWSVAIPTAAQGGTLEFFRSSGSGSFDNTVNQVVLNS